MAGDDDTSSVRAYVPLRKKRKSAHGERESNDVQPYSAAAVNAVPSSSDALQEAEWTRMEHGISVVTDSADTAARPASGDNNNINTNADSSSGHDVPLVVETFEQMHLPSDVLRALHARGITQPTAIQMQAIPSVLSGRDVIGLASTGSGKTLCYVLPLLALLARQPPTQSSNSRYAAAAPLGLIVVPTRELMEQIVHELRHFAAETPSTISTTTTSTTDDGSQWLVVGRTFTALGVCGGVPLQLHVTQLQQQQQQQQSITVVVATPGRLLHLLERQSLTLQHVQYLVIDEVDRMLDVAMESQLRQILHAATNNNNNSNNCNNSNSNVARQTLLWSATMPHFLSRLARSAVLDPITIRVGMGVDHTGRTPLTLLQHIVVVHGGNREKQQQLLQAIRTTPAPPVLVFCNSHASADAIARLLQTEQFHAAALHGAKPQAFRFQVIAAFRAGFVDVLVATDVAARGLDFSDVLHVVIYDMPHTIDDYVHRCGRTGRTGNSVIGRVTALVTPECEIVNELKQLLIETRQVVPRELDRLKVVEPSPSSVAAHNSTVTWS